MNLMRVGPNRQGRGVSGALVISLLFTFTIVTSPTASAEINTPIYEAAIKANAPTYVKMGQISFAPKSATLTSSAKLSLRGLALKAKGIPNIQLSSYYAKASEASSLMRSRSLSVLSYLMTKGVSTKFSFVSGGNSATRRTEIFWYPPQESASANFSAPSAEAVVWRVPTGAKCAYFVIAGAKGGTSNSSDPGFGALVKFARRVTPGQSYKIFVGGQGGSTSFYEPDGGIGGINGGGAGGSAIGEDWLGAGGGGGGWSGVFSGTTPLAIAGGGGGSASSGDFLAGKGGDADADGHAGSIPTELLTGGAGGKAGSKIAGGAGGLAGQGLGAFAGTFGLSRQGGLGADSSWQAAGGGGGGYFGGGGGASSGSDRATSGGGGGGSSLVPVSANRGFATLSTDGVVAIKYSNWSLGTCHI